MVVFMVAVFTSYLQKKLSVQRPVGLLVFFHTVALSKHNMCQGFPVVN